MYPTNSTGSRLFNEAGEPLMDAAAMRLEDELDAMSAMDDAMGLNDYDYTTDDGFDFSGPLKVDALDDSEVRCPRREE